MKNTNRLLELDSLRGIAALSVCFLHFGFYNYGITGLDLFFLISGFVIYMSISNSKSLKLFWISRFVRLFPVYWLSIVIALLFCSLCIVPNPINWAFVAGNLTMVQPLFKTSYFSFAYWTLYVEMLFYLLITIIWVLNLLKNIDWIILICLIFSIVLHTSYLFLGSKIPVIERIYIVIRGNLPLISYFHFFASGIIFYQIYTKGITILRAIVLLISFVLIGISHNISGVAMYFMSWQSHLIICFVYYLTFLLIINHKARLLKTRYLTVLGAISYALYLVHSTFGIWIKDLFSSYIGLVLSSLIGILASLLLALLITYYYDVPVRRWLKTTLNRVKM
jgi:peptidoglycan/LPS O-acetylase OafA/YrhL